MAMSLEAYSLDDPIFIDANIPVYHQTGHPLFGPGSVAFLARVAGGGIRAVTTTSAVGEAMYVMQLEHAASILRSSNRRLLHARLAADKVLAQGAWATAARVLDLVETLEQGGLLVMAAGATHLRDACDIGTRYRLILSDAVHVAVCQQMGIAHVASNDSDLDRVPFLTRWAPAPPSP